QALLVDIPAAPQLPRRDPAEYMVPQALDGLPGVHPEPDGSVFLDPNEWMRGAAVFDARLERTLEQGEGRESFLPTAASCQALRGRVRARRQEGALPGVHCCGNTGWSALLGLGFDIVSLDARLSLTPLLATGAFASLHEEGGTLALGIVPTDFSASDDVGEL